MKTKKSLVYIAAGALALGSSGCGIGDSTANIFVAIMQDVSHAFNPITQSELDEALARAEALDGKYSASKENKEFVDKLNSRGMIRPWQYDDITGKGLFNPEKDMDYVKKILEGNFKPK